MYYLRSKAAVDPIKFTLSSKHQTKFVKAEVEADAANTDEGIACSIDNPDDCLMCGS
jgi:ribonucleoside-diphosphate reductase alpha chain